MFDLVSACVEFNARGGFLAADAEEHMRTIRRLAMEACGLPELYQACKVAKGIVLWAEDHGAKNTGPIIKMVDAAIRKAEGRD